MTRKRNLKVCKPSLRVDVPERAHPVDDEAIILDGRLEALQAVPCRQNTQSTYGLCVDMCVQVMLQRKVTVRQIGTVD